MIERRMFLAGSAAAAAGLGPGGALAQPAAATSTNAGVFRHGVASGDPLPDAVLLWTRVTPTADSLPGSGAGPRVTVGWQVATDPGFRRVVAHGRRSHRPRARPHRQGRRHGPGSGDRPTTTASPSTARPQPVGRTRTAPAPTSSPDRLRFGVVSCANWQAGYFSAYRHLAARDDLDAVLHLGDYVYEYGTGEYGYGQSDTASARTSPPTRCSRLADYRQRHAQYKTDPDLQAPAREVPVGHHLGRPRGRQRRLEGRRGEPQAGRGRLGHPRGRRPHGLRRVDAGPAERHRGPRRRHPDLPPAAVRPARRAEHARPAQLPRPAGRRPGRPRLGRDDPDAHHHRRRADATGSRTRWPPATPQWKLVGNPVMIAPVHLRRRSPQDAARADQRHRPGCCPRDGVPYNVDQWDGYTADRRELFAHLARPRRHRHACSSPATSTRAGPCDLPVDAGDLPDSARLGRRRVRRHLGDLQQPRGHHRHRRRGPRASPSRTRSRPTTAHVKYLDFDDHGFSVLDDHRQAGADGLVRHRRPRRPGRRLTLVDVSLGDRPAARPSPPSTGRWPDEPDDRHDRTAAPRRAAPSCRAAGRSAACRRALGRRRCAAAPRRRRSRKRVYVLVIDGCRPDEIDGGLTPNLLRAARRRHVVPARPFAAGDGDHPQPRDDDDRRAPGPARRAGQRIYDRARRRRPRPRPRHRPARPRPSSSGSTPPAVRPARCCRRSTSTGSSAPAPPTAGSRSPLMPVTGHAPDAVHHGRGASRWSTSSTRDLVFVNLGDIDRVGHSDLTGTTLQGGPHAQPWPRPTCRSGGSSTR